MLENEIKELTAAVRENTEQVKLMIAGREEALAKLTSGEVAVGGGTAPTRRTRTKAAAETADKAETPAAAGAAAPSWNPDITPEGFKALVGPYQGVEDTEVRAARTAEIKAVLAHFGADAINPIAAKPEAKAIEGDDNRRQAAFYLTRLVNGLPIDFSADYDFNADPLTQGDLEPAAPAAAEEEDLLG